MEENHDVNIKGILISGIGLAGIILVGLVLSYLTFAVLGRIEKGKERPAAPMAEERVLPPQPRLQTSTGDDLKKMRREEKAILESFGWVDPEAGIVRIPIENAMDILAARGLPNIKEEKQ